MSGQFVGAGVGECSSQEDKYAWRAALCDDEYDDTPENRRRVKYSKYQGKVEKKKQVRTNPADVANTILKMAKKRAQVDAVITCTAASDIFTQDIEDLPEEVVAEIVGQYAKPSRHASAPPPDSPERDAAIKEAQDVASLGVEAFRKFWAALPKEKRLLIADKMESFKAAAERADAEEAQ
jgi:peroxiredoxin family protein